MTNLQDSVPILGDLPILPNTYYSIELYAEHFIPERNVTYTFAQEENAYWDAGTEMWEWVWARQEKYHLVRSNKVLETANFNVQVPSQKVELAYGP